MIEKAFIVEPEHSLYKAYITENETKRHFNALARGFLAGHNIKAQFVNESDRLCVKFDGEQREQYKKWLFKRTDHNGMSIFLKKSKYQRAWAKEVAAFVNFNDLFAVRNTMAEVTSADGMFTVFDYKGTLYAYIATETGEIKTDGMDEISMGEYQKIVMEAENENLHRN